MATKFAYPIERDLRFERTQPQILKDVQFVLDDATFSASVTDGAAIIACLIALVAFLGLMS
mgnify:CR=1 FL=1